MELDLTEAVDRVRIAVGDIDEPVFLEDVLYQYFIDNTETEYAATIKALEALVAKFAKEIHEKSDSEETFGSELYDNYKELLYKYKNDPSYMGTVTPFAGGISKSDIQANKCNTDANRSSFEVGGTANFDNSIWDN